MSSILTNNGAMVALQTMKSVNKGLGTIQDTLSTGKKVSTSKDNAAVWSISSVMQSDVNGFKAVGDSLSLGQSTVAVARNASEQVKDLLVEMRTKIIAAQEDNMKADTLQKDIGALREQITSVVGAAQFNGLNLLKGSEDMNVLGSLDRSSDGSVTASKISVSRNNLEQTKSELGTVSRVESAAAAVDNGSLDVADSLDVKKGAVITIAGTLALANGESLIMNVNGNDYTVNFATTPANSQPDAKNRYLALTADADAIAAAFTEMISADVAGGLLKGTGLTATAGTGTVTLETQSDKELTFSIREGAGGDTGATAGIAAVASGSAAGDLGSGAATAPAAITTTAVGDSVKATTSTLTLNAGTVAEGDSYRITLNNKNYDYVARKEDTLNDVASGLKRAIDADGIKGLKLAVNTSDAPTTTAVTIDMTFTDSSVSTDLGLTVDNFTGGKAGGGLEELANIDVTKPNGPQAALTHIEDLISTATEAAASFGSDEKRLEIQSEFVSKLTDSLTSGIGTLVDANMEETAARLQALQVQQQLATQALSIANQAPQNILALFR